MNIIIPLTHNKDKAKYFLGNQDIWVADIKEGDCGKSRTLATGEAVLIISTAALVKILKKN